MMTKNKIGYYARKCLAVVPSVPICALGVDFFVKAGWGTDPLTMWELALSSTFNISLGMASLTFEGGIFVLFFFLNRKLVNFGSFAYCFGIGPCLDLMSPMVNAIIPANPSIMVKILCIVVGTALVCLALAYYIPMDFGYQTSDILTLSLGEIIHKGYGISLTIVYAILFGAAWLLGGAWGIGTLVAIFGYGPIVDQLMKLLTPFSLWVAEGKASKVSPDMANE
ncbi:YczE/YyaS/YitT family protein [Levilactobacillus fujinensis]|uniref:YitT family protein n=1 Tax=Levilactobacillus fujinensis TaxID=2486024 RepID=A0ABW1TGV8_9LACO|nr:hypothetical protein [Levilactobacillus fujinensis]